MVGNVVLMFRFTPLKQILFGMLAYFVLRVCKDRNTKLKKYTKLEKFTEIEKFNRDEKSTRLEKLKHGDFGSAKEYLTFGIFQIISCHILLPGVTPRSIKINRHCQNQHVSIFKIGAESRSECQVGL